MSSIHSSLENSRPITRSWSKKRRMETETAIPAKIPKTEEKKDKDEEEEESEEEESSDESSDETDKTDSDQSEDLDEEQGYVQPFKEELSRLAYLSCHGYAREDLIHFARKKHILDDPDYEFYISLWSKKKEGQFKPFILDEAQTKWRKDLNKKILFAFERTIKRCYTCDQHVFAKKSLDGTTYYVCKYHDGPCY